MVLHEYNNIEHKITINKIVFFINGLNRNIPNTPLLRHHVPKCNNTYCLESPPNRMCGVAEGNDTPRDHSNRTHQHSHLSFPRLALNRSNDNRYIYWSHSPLLHPTHNQQKRCLSGTMTSLAGRNSAMLWVK